MGSPLLWLCFRKDLGEETEMVFSISDIDNGFPRWLLMFGDRLTIIKPESLKNDVQDLLETQLERIKTPANSRSLILCRCNYLSQKKEAQFLVLSNKHIPELCGGFHYL